MGFIQKVLLAVLPDTAAKSRKADSREWMCTCPCGHARSVWELGACVGKPRVIRANS
ncbi:MAG: hypothetical protein QOC70_2132 [Verrucomicrobiota bacterium]|jgi:hypothetical protein